VTLAGELRGGPPKAYQVSSPHLASSLPEPAEMWENGGMSLGSDPPARSPRKAHTMTKQTSPAVVDEGVIVEQAPDPDAWWNDADPDIVEGFDLAKDEVLFLLVGVPLLITRVVYRVGVQRVNVPWRDDYVSAECRVAPLKVITMQMPKILARRGNKFIGDKNALPDPADQLVINDGSTGFYRQITQYLEAKELIDLGDDFPVEGNKGECRYDLPRSEWLAGAEEATAGFDISLKCPRGLRYSEYQNDFTAPGESAITWYIA
jgi:hypothetical protein